MFVQIKRDYVTEAQLLKTLGVIFSLNGRQCRSRRLFHRLFLVMESAAVAASGRSLEGGGRDILKAEALILYGTTWERNGFYSREKRPSLGAADGDNVTDDSGDHGKRSL